MNSTNIIFSQLFVYPETFLSLIINIVLNDHIKKEYVGCYSLAISVFHKVRESPEYNRLDRQKLVDLGIDPDILEAASITVPSKLHFRIGGINAGITQNGVTNGVTEPTSEEE